MFWDRQNLFVIAGFVTVGFVSTYFTVILPGFQMMLLCYNGVFVMAGFVIAGCHRRSYSNVNKQDV